MSTFSDTERKEREKILNDASVSLTKLVMKHRSRKAEELRSAELVKRQEARLSNPEQSELERCEDKKQKIAENQKAKKCKRDKISIRGDDGALMVVAREEA